MDMEDALNKIQRIFERLDQLLALPRLPAKVDRDQLLAHRTNLKSLEDNISSRMRCSAGQMKFVNSISRSVNSSCEVVTLAKNPKPKANPR